VDGVWIQRYDPCGWWPLSTVLAGLPVLVLLGLLVSGRVRAWQAAMAGLVTALAVATLGFGMPPAAAAGAVGYGAVFAGFRIVWLIVAAMFLYDIAVATGQFEVMKASVARLSGDRRIQAVLIAFSFGAFIEGAAGFGAPVAISAAFLVGLGFRPFQAAVLCLIANTAPVAWGSIGTPIRTLAAVTGLPVEALSATSGRIMLPLSFLVPFWMVAVQSGVRGMLGVWPALAAVGGAFAGAQFLWSNGNALFGWTFTSFELVNVVASIASLAAGVLILKVWKPRQEWRYERDGESAPDVVAAGASRRAVAKAWMPFALLTLTVLVWGVPRVKAWMAAPHEVPGLGRVVRLDSRPPMPGLHHRVARGPAVTGRAEMLPEDREKAELDLVPLSSTGTAIFLAAVLSGLLLGLRPKELARILGQTLIRLRPAIAAIVAMLGLGFVTKYAGMDAVLGLAFTRTGPLLYPIFGTLLGWLGVALTGSDTSSNVLFGNLQTITARQLGLSPVLMASANTTGGVMGKMIDAQSIVVAAAASGETGHEGRLLRAVAIHSVALALIVGGVVWLLAHVWPDGVVELGPVATPAATARP
jgi:lactate permease